MKISGSSILVICISLFFIFKLIYSYSTQDDLVAKFAKERRDAEDAKKKQNDLYENNYNFNVDSIGKRITHRDITKKITSLRFPIIIYREFNNEIYYDAVINQLLDKEFTSFSYDSINTIVLLKREVLNKGNYQNKKTTGYQTKLTLTFIDKRTMKEIKSVFIDGGLPSPKINYRRSAPESQYGVEPSPEEIISKIKSELKS